MTAPSREPTEAMRPYVNDPAHALAHKIEPIIRTWCVDEARCGDTDPCPCRNEVAAIIRRALMEQDTAARLAGRLEGFAEAREMAAQTAENAISNVDSRGHWSDPSRDEIAREIRALSVTPPEAASEKP